MRVTRSPSPSWPAPRGWPPGRSAEVWIAGSPAPDHYVDVTATFSRKIAALRAHESQIGHLTGLEERLRERLAATAERAGLGDGQLAEAFQVLETA